MEARKQQLYREFDRGSIEKVAFQMQTYELALADEFDLYRWLHIGVGGLVQTYDSRCKTEQVYDPMQDEPVVKNRFSNASGFIVYSGLMSDTHLQSAVAKCQAYLEIKNYDRHKKIWINSKYRQHTVAVSDRFL